MALSQAAVESMLKAMDIIATNQFNNVSYDQTIVCTITDRSKAAKQFYYTVTDGSAKFKAYVLSTQEAEEYDVNDQVYVKIPNGDYSKKKFIEGYYVSEDTVVPVTYVSPFDTFLDMATLTESTVSEGLIANKTAAIPIWQWDISKSKRGTVDDLQANGIYDTLGIQADFKCLLNSYNMRAGTYGLRLDLYVRLNAKSEKHITKSVYLDSSEMFGNPYAFTIFATQAKTFDITSIGTIDGMTLWFYQNNNFIYFDGKEERFLEVDERLLTPNIFVTNVCVSFGSELSKVTDNTIKLFTTNDSSFRQTQPSDINNTKNLGFLWYNKSKEGKYIGFSDGIVDFKRDASGEIINPSNPTIDPYDEINYLNLSAENSRLMEQMGKDIPKDENGLEVSANITDAQILLKKSYTLIQVDLVNTLKAFKERLMGLTIENDNGEKIATINDFFSKEDTGKINVAMKYGSDLETHTEAFMTLMTEALSAAAAIQQHQIEHTVPETDKTITNSNYYSSNIKNILLNLTKELYEMNGNKREFLFNDLRKTIARKYSGFQNIYDTYNLKLEKIFTKLEEYFNEINNLLNDAENRMTSNNKTGITSGYQYLFDTKIITYTERDFSDYHNRYCIYWYRYKEGYSDVDGLMEDNWERFSPSLVFKDTSYSTTTMPQNLGLPTQYTSEGGINYFVPKAVENEGYLSVYLTPDVATEKFKVVIYYNHEKFESNELVFTNLDPIVDKTTLDSNDAIVIKHGTNSFDTYQTSYAQNNALINSRDASTVRTLQMEYNGVLGGNEKLAGAQIFWYIPRNATMLTVDVNNLKNTHGFFTDYYRVARVKEATTARQGPGTNYTATKDTYAVDDMIEAVYDKQNGWYSLKKSNSIGISGRWIPESSVEIIDNDDTYMDGFACFYKTIPFEEKEVPVYDETDPTKEIGTKKINAVDAKSLQFYYKIKDYYVATSLKNTIFCIIKKDEYQFETSISFVFGTQGTSGTDYTILVTPSDTQTAVTKSSPLPVDIKAYNYDNEEINIYATSAVLQDGTLYNPTISWFGPTTFSAASLNKSETNDGTVINAGEFSVLEDREFKSTTGSQFNYCGIAKITVNMFDPAYGNGAKELSAFYPVAWSAGDYYIEGATSVIYDSSGANPVYYKDSYRIFKNNTNEELTDVTWDIKYFMLADASKHGRTPKYMFDIAQDGSTFVYDVSSNWSTTASVSEDVRNEISFYSNYVPTLSNGDNKLKPCSNYITGTYNEATKTWNDLNVYPVVCCYDKNGTQIWAQPILISQNRYPNSMLNHWDGKLKIDDENGTILSTMVSAGFKNTDNTYSGVLMGDIEAGSTSNDNKDGVGVYGYHHGAQSFGLNIDGTAFFGKSGRGRIKIDGNSGTISSASYQQTRTKIDNSYGPAEAGMMIDLDDGFVDMLGTTSLDENTYAPDGTQSRVHANVKSPHFFVVSNTGHRLINIGNSDTSIDIKNYDYTASTNERQSIHDEGRSSLTNFDKGFYLKSDNFKNFEFVKEDGKANTGGSGMFLDLATGRLNAFNLNIASKNLLVDSNADATTFFIVKDNDGCNLINAGQDDFYIQSHTYSRYVLGDRLTDEDGQKYFYPGMHFRTKYNGKDGYDFLFDVRGKYQSLINISNNEYYLQTDNYIPREFNVTTGKTTKYGHGVKLNLQDGLIDAYDFTIRGESSSNETGGSYLLLDSGTPQFTVHLNLPDSDNIVDLDLIHISPNDFIMHSANWLETTIQTTSQRTAKTEGGYNIRSGPGTDKSIVGYSSEGKRVPIYEGPTTGQGAASWYRIGDGQWIAGEALNDFKDGGTVNKTYGTGMEIDLNEGKITAYNSENAGKELYINSLESNYPIQLGDIGNYNFQIGWDGSLRGGSIYAWSIDASGTATFNRLNANGGSLNWMYIGSATMHSGTITNATIEDATITTGTIAGITFDSGGLTAGSWTLSSSGLRHADKGALVINKTNMITTIAGSPLKVVTGYNSDSRYISVSVSGNVDFGGVIGKKPITLNGGGYVPPLATDTVVGRLAWYERNIEYYGLAPVDIGEVGSINGTGG